MTSIQTSHTHKALLITSWKQIKENTISQILIIIHFLESSPSLNLTPTWTPGWDLLGGSTFVLSARLYISPDSNSRIRGLDSWAALDCCHYWNCINKEVQCLFLFGSGCWRKMCFYCYYALEFLITEYGGRSTSANQCESNRRVKGLKVIRDLIQGWRRWVG